MKSKNHLPFLLVLGLGAIGGAWGYRQYILAHRPKPQPPLSNAAPSATPSLAQNPVLLDQATKLEERIAAKPNSVPLRQALFLTYNQLEKPEKAMEQLEAIVRIQPNDLEARTALGKGYLVLKQWPQAEVAYQEMTRRWPKNDSGWQGLAVSRFHQRRYQEAAIAAQQAKKLKPDNPSNQYVLATSLMEYAMQYPQPQLHSSALEQARKELEHLTQVWPKTGDLYYRIGRICMATRDIKGSVPYMEKAAQMLPNRADVPLYLAKAYVSSGNRPQARKVLEQALAQHPNSADMNDALGQLIQSSGEPDADRRSLELFQKAVQIAPKSSRYQERLGTAYLRVNDLKAAQQAFEMASQLNPNRAFPFQQLAAIYTRQGDVQRANQAAKTAEALNFNTQQLSHLEALVNTEQNNVSLRLQLADRYRFLGNLGAARNEYLNTLRIDPKNKHAQADLAALEKTMHPNASPEPAPDLMPENREAPNASPPPK